MGRRQLALTLGALMLCVFLSALDSSIVANALPSVVVDLHGFELYAWVTTGYLLASTAVVPVGGKLGDRYGRKPMLMGGAMFFLAMTLLCGLAQSMPQLILLRTLQGVGGGVMTATVFAIMGQLLAPAERARISGLITATFSLAGAVGPVVGGYLTDTFSWRAVFYVNLPFTLLALLILWRFFPQVGYSGRRQPIDFGGAITSVVGIVLLLLALSLGGRQFAWDSPVVLALLSTGVAVLALFLWLETRVADPVLPLSLLRNNVVAISSTNSLAQSMAQISLALFIPLYAQGVMGTSATVSGTIMVPLLIGMVISNVSAGMLIAHIGRYKAFAIVGFGLAVVGFGLLAWMGPEAPYALLGGTLGLLGVAIGMIFPTLTLSYQSAVEFRELGVATSLNQILPFDRQHARQRGVRQHPGAALRRRPAYVLAGAGQRLAGQPRRKRRARPPVGPQCVGDGRAAGAGRSGVPACSRDGRPVDRCDPRQSGVGTAPGVFHRRLRDAGWPGGQPDLARDTDAAGPPGRRLQRKWRWGGQCADKDWHGENGLGADHRRTRVGGKDVAAFGRIVRNEQGCRKLGRRARNSRWPRHGGTDIDAAIFARVEEEEDPIDTGTLGACRVVGRARDDIAAQGQQVAAAGISQLEDDSGCVRQLSGWNAERCTGQLRTRRGCKGNFSG
jgi:EmrB/QacA subfamily drug resistance transporter